ncbi:MAG TPA: hypothetical protein VFB60_10110 [Ktedonobacteraceae bacterium]|nr:hypothetical protein [Ktedonobacteraceae bacterium]
MTPLHAIWRALLRSTRNMAYFDLHRRIGMLVALLIQGILALWALSRLIPLFTWWQAQGTTFLNFHLWLTCLMAWAIMVPFVVIATLMTGLGSDEALLLAVQPIDPATRLRGLYIQVLWQGTSTWLPGEASVIGLALSLTCGWAALPWLLLLVLGALSMVWLSVLVTLLVVRYVFPHPGWALFCAVIFVTGDMVGYLLVQHLHGGVGGIHLPSESSGTNAPVIFPGGSLAIATWLSPVAGSCTMLVLLLLAWFPLAQRTGLLYLAALQQQQGRDRSPRAFIISGFDILLILLKRRRTPVGAILFKGTLQQSRHFLAWLRLIALVGMLLLFPWLRPWLASLHLNDILQVAFYAASVAFLALLEYAPYAIGSEGARLALYLSAPLNLTTFLRARLCSYLLPAMIIGWLSALLLGYWAGLSMLSLLLALVLLGLILTGYVALAVLGSAWDADLTQRADDPLQTLVLEEFPITPRRLLLLGLTIPFFGGMLLLCWKLSAPATLLALACLDMAVFMIGERLGKSALARLSM